MQQAITVKGDVCKISDLDILFKTTHDKLGKIDVLVANAGIASRRPFAFFVRDEKFDDLSL